MARSCLATTWFIFNGLSEYSKVISVEGETLCRAGGAVSKGREGGARGVCLHVCAAFIRRWCGAIVGPNP